MRKNPYLKQEQEFRPLLMRGSLGNNFLNTNAQTQQEFNLASEIPKKTYDLNGVSFDMVLAPSLNPNGTILSIMNVEICTTECTQELFEGVMGFNYSLFNYMLDSAKRPVEMVTWFDCVVFCNKLSEIFDYVPYYDVTNIQMDTTRRRTEGISGAEVNIVGGNGFRLPTVAEWGTFAKAGTNNEWSGTNNEKEVGDYAWYDDNSGGEPRPVATKKPNEWGIYDMNGNVWEWCWDKRHLVATDSLFECSRLGGSCRSRLLTLSLGQRAYYSPGLRISDVGFRFVRTIEQQK